MNSGIGKILGIQTGGSAYFDGFSKVFVTVWAKSNPYPFMTDFLTNAVAPNAPTVVTACEGSRARICALNTSRATIQAGQGVPPETGHDDS